MRNANGNVSFAQGPGIARCHPELAPFASEGSAFSLLPRCRCRVRSYDRTLEYYFLGLCLAAAAFMPALWGSRGGCFWSWGACFLAGRVRVLSGVGGFVACFFFVCGVSVPGACGPVLRASSVG